MAMRYQLLSLPLDAIDRSDEYYFHRAGAAPLAAPPHEMLPVIVEAWGGTYRILDGFRRYDACRNAGVTVPIAALAVENSGVSDKALFSFVVRINENTFVNDWDRAFVVDTACRIFRFSDDADCRLLARVCGVHPSWNSVGVYARLWRLSLPVRSYCQREGMGKKFASSFFGLTHDEQQNVVDVLLSSMRFSESDMQKCTGFLREICARDGRSLSALLASEDIRQISASDLPPRERGVRVCRFLARLRYPVLTNLDEQKRTVHAVLRSIGSVSLDVPDNYEKGTYTVSITAKDKNELRALAHRVETHEKLYEVLETFDEIQNGLRGDAKHDTETI